jgi:hypothetical protein
LNFDKKKKMVDITNNVAEIAKLNHVIDRSEREMVRPILTLTPTHDSSPNVTVPARTANST